jgi:hypothetical protein
MILSCHQNSRLNGKLNIFLKKLLQALVLINLDSIRVPSYLNPQINLLDLITIIIFHVLIYMSYYCFFIGFQNLI